MAQFSTNQASKGESLSGNYKVDDISQILFDTAAKLFEDFFDPAMLLSAEKGAWLSEQWQAVEELGLPMALAPEDKGGFGLAPADALELVRIAGRHAIPLPLAETMVANRVLASCGVSVRKGPACFAPVSGDDEILLEKTSDGWSLKGELTRVPWGRNLSTLVVCCSICQQDYLAVLSAGQYEVLQDVNLANEPRDTLRVDINLPADAVIPVTQRFRRKNLFAVGATIRSLAIAGALNRVLDLTVTYTQERSQFGRAIGKFQAIQHYLAQMAGECAAANASADLALEALAHDGDMIAAAIAKSRGGEAAGAVAALAHQIHGAIGFTQEHALHFYTRRLWSWRDEFGSEAYWNRETGAYVLNQEDTNLWHTLTGINQAVK